MAEEPCGGADGGWWWLQVGGGILRRVRGRGAAAIPSQGAHTAADQLKVGPKKWSEKWSDALKSGPWWPRWWRPRCVLIVKSSLWTSAVVHAGIAAQARQII